MADSEDITVVPVDLAGEAPGESPAVPSGP